MAGNRLGYDDEHIARKATEFGEWTHRYDNLYRDKKLNFYLTKPFGRKVA